MDAEGGTIEFSRNLRGERGAYAHDASRAIDDDSENSVMPHEDDDDRLVMALLLEMGPPPPDRLASELSSTHGRCGDELVLESRGLVSRDDEGGAR